MKSLQVPDFVARDFSIGDARPGAPTETMEAHVSRVYLLVSEALAELPRVIGHEWEIAGQPYGSGQLANEPCVLERCGTLYVIYFLQRGNPSAIALFSTAIDAADYFVWVVSKGQRRIDWSKHLKMER